MGSTLKAQGPDQYRWLIGVVGAGPPVSLEAWELSVESDVWALKRNESM